MFGRKDKNPPPVAQEPTDARGGGKNRPTPKRREAQQANRRPLVPTDRKAAARAARERMAKEREEARLALITGDESKLPAADRGPLRRFVRDSVDSRFSVGEVMLPALFVLVGASLLGPRLVGPETNAAGMIVLLSPFALWAVMLITILDAVFAWRKIKKRLLARFGADTDTRGLPWYAFRRCTQIRRWRMPKPMIERGQPPR